MDQISTPSTTADSAASGRLVAGVGSGKKCLKCAIKKTSCDGAGGCGKKKKHDGKGGIPAALAPSYGNTIAQTATPSITPMTSKAHKASAAIGGLKLKGVKTSKVFSKLASSKMKLGKLSSKISAPKIPKGFMKGLF
jgi:hypothetical protein